MSAEPIPTPQSQLAALVRARAAAFCATLQRLDGASVYTDPGTGRELEAESGLRFAPGTELRILQGRALIRFDDGTDLWLAEGARVVIGDWTAKARSVRLLAGRLLALVATALARPFTVSTSHSIVRVTGTALEIHAAGDALQVCVYHGSIIVENPHGAVRASRGSSVTVPPHAQPQVGKLDARARDAHWAGTLEDSAANSATRAAFAAVLEALGHRPVKASGGTGTPRGPRRGRLFLLVLLVVIAVASIYLYTKKREAPVDGVPGGPKGLRVKGPGRAGEGKFVVNGPPGKLPPPVRDGEPVFFGKEGPVAGAPVDHVFTKHVAPGDGPRGGPLGTEKEKTVDREMQAAMEMYRQLVGSGMSAQEAGRVVSAAASDSLRRQLGKVVTSVDIGGEDGESPGNVRVLIRLGDEEGEGVPPASAPEGAVPKP